MSLVLHTAVHIFTLFHPPFFSFASRFFTHSFDLLSFHWYFLPSIGTIVYYFFFTPHPPFPLCSFSLSPVLLSWVMFDPLLLFSLPVSRHIAVLLLMTFCVRLWLHRWNDIMSHNLLFISQRARAGRRQTHQSQRRHTEPWNPFLQLTAVWCWRGGVHTELWLSQMPTQLIHSFAQTSMHLADGSLSICNHIQTLTPN